MGQNQNLQVRLFKRSVIGDQSENCNMYTPINFVDGWMLNWMDEWSVEWMINWMVEL